MKLLYTLLLMSVFSSCTDKKKKCDFQQKSVEMSIYNDVLIELVEGHFYYRYLGKEGEKIMSKHYTGYTDSTQEAQQIITVHNKLLGNPTLFQTIYLRDENVSDSAIRNNFSYYSYGRSKSIDKILVSISLNRKSVLDSINLSQFKYKAKDFYGCTFKIKSITENTVKNFDREIGLISFSKIFINKDEAILRSDFNCGGLCGKGYILKVKKINNHWKIIDWATIWIS